MSLGALYRNNLAHPGQDYYQKNKEDLQVWFLACLKSQTCKSVCLEAARTGQRNITLTMLEVGYPGTEEAAFVDNLKPRCAEQDFKSFVQFMRSVSETQYVPLEDLRKWFRDTAASSEVYSIYLLHQSPTSVRQRFCLFIQFN